MFVLLPQCTRSNELGFRGCALAQPSRLKVQPQKSRSFRWPNGQTKNGVGQDHCQTRSDQAPKLQSKVTTLGFSQN